MNLLKLFGRLAQKENLCLGLICVIALGLRLCNLDATSLWIDEIYSLIVANTHLFPQKLDTAIHPASYFYEQYLVWQGMDWGRLMALLKINVHMPLYYLLLNIWLKWAGNNAWGLRSFSAIFSTLMLLPLFSLGKAMGGQRAGLSITLVAAMVPFQIYYGQEGRMYALSLFWTALAGLAYWKILFTEKSARWAWIYALAVSGGLLSHYMFVFFLGFQGLFAAFWLIRSRDWRKITAFLPAMVALAAIGLWWAPVYRLQQQGIDEDYHFAKGLLAWSRYLSVPVWQPLVVIAGDNRWERAFYIPITILLFLAFSVRQRLPWGNGHAAGLMETRFALKREGYLLGWILLPTLLQVAYDFWKQTHISIIDRYAMLISPAMCVWLGLSLAYLLADGKKVRYCAGILISLMVLLAALNVAHPSRFRDEHNKDQDIRAKMHYFVQNAAPHDLIFVNGPFGAPNLAAYYLQQEAPTQPMIYWINRYQGQAVALPDPRILKPYRRVWLFRYRANNERGLQTAKDYLQKHFPHLTQSRDWFIYSRTN